MKVLSKIVVSDDGQPGQNFTRWIAIVSEVRAGVYQLDTRIRWGDNQGRLEEREMHQRKYRAKTLDELLPIGIAESRGDEDMNDPQLIQAIRDAIFEAQDAAARSLK